jgi:D-aminoacyl-tRNA deacylase
LIALLQRVSEASVAVSGRRISSIGQGILVFVAVEPGDDHSEVERMSDRLVKFRLFRDDDGRMNRDISQVGGQMLLVPQFTLAADTASGHRPSFSGAAAPELGRQRFGELVDAVRQRGQAVATGEFGADMQVALVNDGPVTFLLRVTRDHQTLTNLRPMPRD